jgi:DNA-binding CsgD family transcriptional regulator
MNHDPDASGADDRIRIVSRRPDGSVLLSNASALTAREIEILGELSLGKSNAQIASELFLTVHTIEYYATRIYQKLGVRNRTQAAIVATRLSLPTRNPSELKPLTSRETQDASPSAASIPSVAYKETRRKLMTLISGGLAGVVLAVVAGVGLFSASLPAMPFLARSAETSHCVAQPEYVLGPGATQPEPLLPRKATVCYRTFGEAILSLGQNPDDYRPPR